MPPFVFVGIGDANEERCVEGTERSLSTLDIYPVDQADGECVTKGYLADAMRQDMSEQPHVKSDCL